jgi:hypothetical protein
MTLADTLIMRVLHTDAGRNTTACFYFSLAVQT